MTAVAATLTRVTAKPPVKPPRYAARCDHCRWTGREFSRYGTAENAVKDHVREHAHDAYVLDQYGMRVVGSTVRPGGVGT